MSELRNYIEKVSAVGNSVLRAAMQEIADRLDALEAANDEESTTRERVEFSGPVDIPANVNGMLDALRNVHPGEVVVTQDSDGDFALCTARELRAILVKVD